LEGKPETEETTTDSKAGVMYLDYNSLYASAYALVFFFFQSLLLGSSAGRRRRRRNCRSPAIKDELRGRVGGGVGGGGGGSFSKCFFQTPLFSGD
jgi:hypothetical protein